ncbi:MAG: hypothetical protein JXR51_04420 [Bacteroidales bacterium]|nr:hypothetical protein [Bacteroidales bacterium]
MKKITTLLIIGLFTISVFAQQNEQKTKPTIEFENKIIDENLKDGELYDELSNAIEEWKNVESPFIATFNGVEFGDYFHIMFTDKNNFFYDFGFGNNDFGKYELYLENDEEGAATNPKYLNKTFKIWWTWKMSSFYCCSGEYNVVKAHRPSIIKIELIENNK